LTGCIAIAAVIFYAARAGTNIPPGPPNVDRPQQLVSAPAPQPQTMSVVEKPVSQPAVDKTTPPAPRDELPPAHFFTKAAGATQIYQHVLKSTVLILCPMRGNRLAGGSGTLIDSTNRWILTSYHVIHNARRIVVFFPKYQDGQLIMDKARYINGMQDEDAFEGRVVAQDTRADLALIQIPRVPQGVQALAIGKVSVQAGESIHSVGTPGASAGMWVYTAGRVRGNHAQEWQAGGEGLVLNLKSQVVETDSPVNPGDSGGPLVNEAGEMVGVTHGMHPRARLLTIFIDLTEVTRFVEAYAQRENMAWHKETHGLTGHADPTSVLEVVRYLQHSDPKTRGQAAERLGELGGSAKLAIRPLLKLAKSEPDDYTRRLALDSLNRIGAPDRDDLDTVQDLLADSNVDLRKYAVRAIGKMGPDGQPAASKLGAALKDRDPRVRESAARALAMLGAASRDTSFPALAGALQDSEHEVRAAAIEALAVPGMATPPDVAFFSQALKLSDPTVRAQAARILGQLGPSGKSALPAIIELAKSPDMVARRGAVEALAQFGTDAKDAVPTLATALSDSDKDVRKHAVLALGKLGADAKPAAYALTKTIGDVDLEVRRGAIASVAKVGVDAKTLAPMLAQALADKSVRMEAMAALADLGPDARPAVPNLVAVLEQAGTDRDLISKVAATLGKVGKSAVKDLIKAMSSNTPAVRLGAATALGDIGPAAKEALKVLRLRAAGDPVVEVRQASENAVIRITGKP
jgi:HEAT repeat protein/S1-C subfamily serine protease